MGLYERPRRQGPYASSSPSFIGPQSRTRSTDASVNSVPQRMLPEGALALHRYASSTLTPPPFPLPAFPQEERGLPARHETGESPSRDTATAAGNLLSLIQSMAPGRAVQPPFAPKEPRRDGSFQLLLNHEPEVKQQGDQAGTGGDSTSDELVSPVAPAQEPVRPVKRTKRQQASTESSTPSPSATTGPKTRAKTKRATSSASNAAKPATTSATAKEEPVGATPKRKRRDKKPTYIVRRERKELLEAELVELQAQVVALRRASGIPDAFFEERERLAARAQENARLREESRKQDLLLCNAHSMLSAEYVMMRTESPIETFIHLTADLKQRRAALLGIRDMKLTQADAFVTARSKLLPKTTPWCQENKFETPEGDFCAEKMDNTPFHGVRSVRQVFDSLQFFFRNMEISISEMLGDITVREDDDSTAANSLSNHRLVSTMSHGTKVEKNIVKFFKIVEPGESSNGEGSGGQDTEDGASLPYALVATDAVDVDDLYPYVPSERIRMDINAAMKFTEHRCKKKRSTKTSSSVASMERQPTGQYFERPVGFYGRRQEEGAQDGAADEDEYERVVVLTRWFRMKLHRTEIELPPHVLQEVRQGLACFSDTMVQTMHRIIYESR